jgi:UDP-glucose 4-epimerase
MSPYAASKLAGEAYFAAYQETFNIKSIVFRLFNVFGPRQSFNHPYAAVIPNFIQSYLRESPIRVEGSGMQTRDFTYIDTVTDTFLSAINRRLHIKTPVNLALGSSVSIIELIKLLKLISQKEVQIDYKPRRIGDVDNSESDPTLFQNKFPEIVSRSLYNSLEQTYNYYKNKYE